MTTTCLGKSLISVKLVLLAWCMGTVPFAFSQSALDGFDPNANSNILASALQPDGKIIIGGQFTIVGGVARSLLARLNTDGGLDTAFNPSVSGGAGTVNALALQGDGSILVGGDFTTIASQSVTNLARLNADGSLDGTFNSGADAVVRTLFAQDDGTLLVGGRFTWLSGQPCNYLGRLIPDGTLDTTFNPLADGPINCLAVQMDGKIAVGGAFQNMGGQPRIQLARLNSDGTLDLLFNPGTDGIVDALAIQADGKWVVGGEFNNLGTLARSRLGRLNSDGSVDATFNPPANGNVLALTLQVDGKILVGGAFTSLAGQARNRLGRLNPDSSLDTSFPGANGQVNNLAVQPDGKILVFGQFSNLAGQTRNRVGRLYLNGTLDANFNPGANGIIITMVPQADGKLLAGGEFTLLGGQSRSNIGRINLDGSLDLGFNAGRNSSTNLVICQLPLTDGRTMIGGQFPLLNGKVHVNLARLNADGSIDSSFTSGAGDNNSYVYALGRQANGDILVAGQFTTLAGRPCTNLGRIHPDGSLDKIFNPGPNYLATSVAVQEDGKILVGGFFTQIAGQPSTNIARLNADGTPDPSFSSNAAVGDQTGNYLVYNVAVQADGKILVGGQFNAVNGQPLTNLGRLNSDGSLDSTFNPRPGAGLVISVVPQTDGKILVAGEFATMGGKPRLNLARINPDGSLDPAFNPGAGDTNSFLYSVAIQADGKILVGGAFSTLGGQSRSLLGRVTSGSAASQSLDLAPGATAVVWSRTGAGPEVGQVAFEQSNDGLVYTALGRAVRTFGDWVLDGLSFPRDQIFYVRARGFSVGGFANGSGGIIESVQQFYVANHPPVALCNDVTVYADASCTASASIDNGSFDPDFGDTVTLVQSPPGPYPLGTNSVTLTVTDNYGASTSCVAMVRVLDAVPPTIQCPDPITVSTVPGACGSNVVFQVGATAHCGQASVVCVPSSGSTFAQGVTTVSCTALDSSSNATLCSFTVTVLDTQPPQLACPPNIVINTAPGSCANIVTFDVTAQDNCLGTISAVCSPPSGATFARGTNTVTCRATDLSGNSSQCSFSIVVVDQEPPSIACPADLEFDFTNAAGSVATFAIAASDNCAVVSTNCFPPSGSVFPVGATPVRCVATDASSHSSVCTFTVTVLGPRGLLERVFADLSTLRPTVTNREDGNGLDDSMRHLTNALDSDLWLDQIHLESKHGDRVFGEDKGTVHKLGDLINNKKSLLADGTLQGFIDPIVRADRWLAVIGIDAAAASGLNPKKIAEDTQELAKGDDAISKGKYDEGLDHYRNAWQHALHLVVKATPKADGSVHLEFVGLSAGPYLIQSSTNLVDWVTVGSALSDPQGQVVFDDPPAGNAPRRFYRVLSP